MKIERHVKGKKKYFLIKATKDHKLIIKVNVQGVSLMLAASGAKTTFYLPQRWNAPSSFFFLFFFFFKFKAAIQYNNNLLSHIKELKAILAPYPVIHFDFTWLLKNLHIVWCCIQPRMLFRPFVDMEMSFQRPKSDRYFKHATFVMSISIVFFAGKACSHCFCPQSSQTPYCSLFLPGKKFQPLQLL